LPLGIVGVLKRFLPRSLLGRSLLIVVTPLVILQVVTTFIFYESHWHKVSQRMARGVAGDVSNLIDGLRQFPEPDTRAWLLKQAANTQELFAEIRPGEILPNETHVGRGDMERTLIAALRNQLNKPFRVDTETRPRYVIVDVQMPEGVLNIVFTHKRLFSFTTYVFVLWMVGTSLILLGVATIFMRNQIRPIRRLAQAADDFGKGRDAPTFKPEGAREVRQAAKAFIAMRERIRRQIHQRTTMLAGVSHDLRTPLTRMKLQLEMMKGDENADALKIDVAEMERMLDSYLAFARGEGAERPVTCDLNALLGDVVRQARRKGGEIDLLTNGDIHVPLRPGAFSRCLTNLIENAVRHARHVAVSADHNGNAIEVAVDDDGPGIPADARDEVFKPFARLEGSRNPETGGVGLGLTIARDVARGHGGELVLGDSPLGGLRAVVRLPV